MAYKSIIALAAAAVVATLALPTSDANARVGGHGGGFHGGGFHGGGFNGGGFRGGPGFGGFRGGLGFRGFRGGFYPGYYAGYGGGCWRWVQGYYGPRRVWACGGGYYPY
jgi:hypothetical protein